MPDKVNRFNTDCSAVITAATCQILWKFVVNNFYSYNKKPLAYFLWTQCTRTRTSSTTLKDLKKQHKCYFTDNWAYKYTTETW